MGIRKQYLPWLACLVVAAVSGPALASGLTAKTPAVVDAAYIMGDNYFQEVGQPVSDAAVTITAGGTVTFRSPIDPATNQGSHNVDFRFDPNDPNVVCNQTVASPAGEELDVDGRSPMPPSVVQPGWEGYCTFSTAATGTYTFFCQAHGGMEGTITVTGGTGTPTPTPTATPSPTATPTPPAGTRISARDRTSPTSRNWWQDASTTNENDNSVTVNVNQSVIFDFPAPSGSGTQVSVHNVVFNGAQSPGFCQQTVGPWYSPTTVDPNTTPPLPDNVTVYGWVGSCRFDAPGHLLVRLRDAPGDDRLGDRQPNSDAHAVPHRVAYAVPDRVAYAVPDGSPTPTPTASPTPSPTASPTPSPTASPTPSPTASPTPSPTASPTPTATASPTPAPTPDTIDHERSDGADEQRIAVVRVHGDDSGLDVRVQARRARRRDRHVCVVHDAAGLHVPGGRHVHVLGARDEFRKYGSVAGDAFVHG